MFNINKITTNKFLFSLKILKRTFNYLAKISPIQFSLMLLFSFLTGISPTIGLIFLKSITNELQIETHSVHKLYIIVLLYSVFLIFNLLVSKLSDYTLFLYAQKVILAVNSNILNKTNEVSLSDFEKSDMYNFIQKADQQSNDKLLQFFYSWLSIGTALVGLISSSVILISWKWYFIMIIFLISCIRSLILFKQGEKQFILHTNRISDDRRRGYLGFLLKNDLFYKEVKVYNLHGFFTDKYVAMSKRFNSEDKEIKLKTVLYDSVLSLANLIVLLFLIMFCVIDALNGKILIGDTISYIQTGNNVRSYSESFLNSLSSVINDSLYINQLFEFFDYTPIETYLPGINSKIIEGEINEICLDNVSFNYQQKKILKNISITFRKGNIYSIVGANGSGKSTLLKLISGFYRNYSGNITVNGIELRDIDLNSYWKKLGILFQDFSKYEFTVQENISLNSSSTSSNKSSTQEILKSLDSQFLEKFNLNSQLGYWFDDGHQLSAGEWIKIGISRALFRTPDILLLDEPTAPLDKKSERNLLNTINRSKSNSITIFITHDTHLLNNFESTIILMDNGRIEKDLKFYNTL